MSKPTRPDASQPADKSTGSGPLPLNGGELDQTLGFFLRKAWVHMEQEFTKVMAGTGITPQLYAMLIVIERNPGCRISDLCRAIGVSPNNIVPAIDVLLDRGLVFRDFSSHDRRAKRLGLTDTGAAYLGELRATHQTLTDHFTAKVGEQGMATLIQLLRKISDPE